MAQQEMSYAQALNEAKQVIIQQSSRIKGDLEKIKGQQQTIVDQAARITEHEGRIAELAGDLQRRGEELRTIEARYTEAEAGRQQAEGVVNRQGERINNLQSEVADLGRRLEDANNQIADLTRERDELRTQLPTNEDIEALNGMLTLLSQKRSAGSRTRPSARCASSRKPPECGVARGLPSGLPPGVLRTPANSSARAPWAGRVRATPRRELKPPARDRRGLFSFRRRCGATRRTPRRGTRRAGGATRPSRRPP
jgi:hypothetical protein